MILKLCFVNCCTFVVTEGTKSYITLSIEQISPMLCYYVQDVYQKKQLATRLDKRQT